MEPIEELLLLHVPPAVELLRVLSVFLHHWNAPVIAPGVGLTDTVTVLVCVQKPVVPVRV
jgi:hypothetical protein